MHVLILIIELLLAPVALALAALLVNIVRGVLSRIAKHAALRSIQGPPRTSLLAGNLHELYDVGGLPHLEALTDYGGVAKVHGLFGDVLLAISDPLALTHILVTDVHDFPALDLSGTLDINYFLLGPGLLSTNGPEHRRQRKLMNALFSHARMRDLMPLMLEISGQLRDSILSGMTGDEAKLPRGLDIDMAEELGRAALEFIGRAGLGHTFHAFEGTGDKYVHAVKDLIPTFAVLGPFVPLFVMSGASRLPPSLLRVMGKATSLIVPPLRHLLQLVDLMNDEMGAICEALKISHKEGPHEAIMSALVEANEEGQISDEELTAQAITLLIAVQDKLRREITQSVASSDVHTEEPGYDTLMSLPYLDSVCKETLRLFAPTPLRNRRCIKDSAVPLLGGKKVYVPSGTEILVNIHGPNTDVHIWGTDAKVWRPERWLEALLPSVTEVPGVYSNILSFLAGPKACIGLNFALLEMKVVLATLLPVFRFELPVDHEIEWRFGQTITPNVKAENGLNPRMPLHVEAL
ncbi:unnamed protein product [Peniophora sp. CBMAI 1063]|nr:unnamed protein product [Peniophora sp. CBMAI 1063]